MDNLLTADFDYFLPEELIASKPTDKRDQSRLLVLNKNTGEISHLIFSQITEILNKNDLLVFNNTKVIPARIFGKKETGAKVEILLLRKITDKVWECIVRPSKRLKEGTKVLIGTDFAIVKKDIEKEVKQVEFFCDDFNSFLQKHGKIPLPPYIASKLTEQEQNDTQLLERYQTVYASKEGASAAPTAGLHFTKEILERLKKQGVQMAFVTLHTGIGTFKPVTAEKITDHKMAEEEYEITEDAAEIINDAIKSGKRIIAVGTTVTRCLEDCWAKNKKIIATKDNASIFIYPPFKFNVVQALITNFHFPKSTLIMLVSAFAGKDKIFKAYQEAIDKKYRFYSFGDAMLIV